MKHFQLRIFLSSPEEKGEDSHEGREARPGAFSAEMVPESTQSLWRENIQPGDLLRLDCQTQHRATGKTGHFLLLNQKQRGWGQKLATGGRDQFVKETGLEPGQDKGIVLKQRLIEGLPLVSAVLSVKPVLLHT